jgi:copper chaperone CopZ
MMKQTLKFKTNINCEGCLAKVTPFLDENKHIVNWEVDLTHDDRLLTIETNNLMITDIIEVVNMAGYKAEEI